MTKRIIFVVKSNNNYYRRKVRGPVPPQAPVAPKMTPMVTRPMRATWSLYRSTHKNIQLGTWIHQIHDVYCILQLLHVSCMQRMLMHDHATTLMIIIPKTMFLSFENISFVPASKFNRSSLLDVQQQKNCITKSIGYKY